MTAAIPPAEAAAADIVPLSVEEASAALVKLINRRPSTPSLEEIRSIVAQVKVRPRGGQVRGELAAEIRAAMPALRSAIDAENEMPVGSKDFPAVEARARELQRRFDALRDQLWATPPGAFDDLVILAEVAQFEARDWPPPYEHLPMTSDRRVEGDQMVLAFAHLAVAVLRMGGLRHAQSCSGFSNPLQLCGFAVGVPTKMALNDIVVVV